MSAMRPRGVRLIILHRGAQMFAADGGLQFGFYLKREEEETILTQLSVIQFLE